MPIKLPASLPAYNVLSREGVMVMPEDSASKQDIRPCRRYAFRQHRLYRRGRAHRHEGRRPDITPRCTNKACARSAVSALKIEGKSHCGRLQRQWRSRNRRPIPRT